MLKKFQWLAAALLLTMGSLSAYIHPCPGRYGFEAEYLYLYPSIDDTYFVIQSQSPVSVQNGHRYNNDFKFHSGFRVGGIYALCDYNCPQEFQLYYTRLYAKQNRTVSGSNLFATIGRSPIVSSFGGYTGFATSHQKVLYQRVDGLYALRAWNCCGVDLYFKGGLEYAYIRSNQAINYTTTNLTVNQFANLNQFSRVYGIGPELGFDFNYDIWRCNRCLPGTLSLAIGSTGSLIAAKSTQGLDFTANIASPFQYDDQRTWRIIPAWHARIGLNYATCFSCFSSALEVGYEFNSYSRAVTRTTFPDDQATSLSVDEYYNFDVQGLYVSLAFTF